MFPAVCCNVFFVFFAVLLHGTETKGSCHEFHGRGILPDTEVLLAAKWFACLSETLLGENKKWLQKCCYVLHDQVAAEWSNFCLELDLQTLQILLIAYRRNEIVFGIPSATNKQE